MKIYRATITYNNGDSNEWERWYTEASPWYTDRAIAEHHITELLQFRDYMYNKNMGNSQFECFEPKIEEQDIMSEQSNMVFKDQQFKPLDYIRYDGEYKITNATLHIGLWNWTFYVVIDDLELFDVILNGTNINIKHCNDGDSKFYQYDLSDKNKLLSVINDFAETVKPLYLEYYNQETKRYNEFSVLDEQYNDKCEDEDYLKLRHEKWCEWVSVNAYAAYDLLNQFSYITISKGNITEFENKIEYFDGHPEYSELIEKIKKLRNI